MSAIPATPITELETVTGEQMLALDNLTEAHGMLLYQMMENAGRSMAQVALEIFKPKQIQVFAGSGGNGGGVLVAARHLANLGHQVTLVATKEAESLDEVPARQLGLAVEAGVSVGVINPDADCILDGLLGYSLSGAPKGIVADYISQINLSGAQVLSLDIPSGMSTGIEPEAHETMRAAATLSVAALKHAHAHKAVGRIFLADIGIPRSHYQKLGIEAAAPKTWISEITR